ncbi:hypothetical protein BTZ20_2841 [Rhodococcus sp. MTM3W5.2]|nr:hypothetical protein BTZ20_2841 [Rhodococcus sp. MTM3W5.2]
MLSGDGAGVAGRCAGAGAAERANHEGSAATAESGEDDLPG